MRAVYAWCYGFETNSGNMPWLRAKVIAAIDDAPVVVYRPEEAMARAEE